MEFVTEKSNYDCKKKKIVVPVPAIVSIYCKLTDMEGIDRLPISLQCTEVQCDLKNFVAKCFIIVGYDMHKCLAASQARMCHL